MARAAPTVQDARGLPVAGGTPQRIVSLVPSLTDTVCGLGAGDRLAGRTIYCTEPRSEVRDVPTFGGTKNPDLAGIIAAKPDLVLACLEENPTAALRDLGQEGLPVFAVMPRSMDDVAGLLRDYGILLGVEAAAGRALADLTAARLTAAGFRAARSVSPRTAVMIWKDPWMVAGGGTHINAVLAELGLANAVARRRDYFEISLEDLARRNLDAVLLPDEPYAFTPQDSDALAAAGVVATPEQAVRLDGKLLTWYGTRTARSLRALVKLWAGVFPAD